MKKKLCIILSITVLLFIVGCTNKTHSGNNNNENNNGGTIIENEYKTIKYYSWTELSKESNDVNTIYESMKETSYWEALGMDSDTASIVANRVSVYNSNQITNILYKVQNHNHQFKVIIIRNNGVQVNFGTYHHSESSNNNLSDTDIIKIEVEIDYYEENMDMELSYELKSSGTIYYEYENEKDYLELEGTAAKTYVEPVVTYLSTNPSDKSEIISNVVSILEANSNYRKIEIEIKYADNSKTEVKDYR